MGLESVDWEGSIDMIVGIIRFELYWYGFYSHIPVFCLFPFFMCTREFLLIYLFSGEIVACFFSLSLSFPHLMHVK